MRVSYNWISKYVDLKDISPAQIAEALTLAGIEVEERISCHRGIQNVVVGYVEEVQPHPNADRLRVCQVRLSEGGPLQTIVCGAPNVEAGQFVPVARVGATLPNGLVIKKSRLRGVSSEGMICSIAELGLPSSLLGQGEEKGIWVLPSEAPLGADIVAYLGLDDEILVCSPTANRTDVLSMRGMATEVGAIVGREVHLPEIPLLSKDLAREVKVEDPSLCPFYSLQVLRGIQRISVPWEIRRQLIDAGIAVHSPAVDITNWVMLDLGQPLHVYDATKVQGSLCVRRAHEGEKLEALNGQTYALTSNHLVVGDCEESSMNPHSAPLALAGIIGGKSSQVTTDTQEILLESACFHAPMIRATAHQLRCQTTAAVHFGKGGLTALQARQGMALAVQWFQKLGMPEIQGLSFVQPEAHARNLAVPSVETIQVRHARLTKTIGQEIQPRLVVDFLKRLQCSVQWLEAKGLYEVKPPSFRSDLTEEIDIVEEVIRLYGHHNLPFSVPCSPQQPQALTSLQRLRRQVRRCLTQWGWQEASTYSLVSKEEQELWQPAEGDAELRVFLSNPLSEEHVVLRTSLLPALLRVVVHNLRHGQGLQRWFELAKTYHKIGPEDQPNSRSPYEERWTLVWLGVGETAREWGYRSLPAAGDPLTLQGMVTSLAQWLGVQVSYQAASPAGWHPGRTVEVWLTSPRHPEKRLWGHVGQLHPKNLQAADCSAAVSAAVLDWDLLDAEEWQDRCRHHRIGSWSRFPSVRRDLALVVDKKLPVAEVTEAIHKYGGPLLQQVSLFDVFSLSEDQQSLAYALTYQREDRTLTEEEVQTAQDQLVAFLSERMDATLR